MKVNLVHFAQRYNSQSNNKTRNNKEVNQNNDFSMFHNYAALLNKGLINFCGKEKSFSEQLEKRLEKSNNDGYIIPYGDSPLDEYETGKRVYMDILNTANKYVDIITPYLILDDELLSSIIYASNRGIKVRIIMPHIPDKKIVYYLGRSYYKDLISSGVEIYEFKRGFTHAKMFISDNCKAVVGTINLDYRSLYLHFECACYIYKNKVIEEIQEDYNKTINESIRITEKEVDDYNIMKKTIGRVLRFLAPFM